ncbi:GGDEF domain protein [Synechococcus sp. PCC 7335]|uniref:diguanylate cyclase domain-containing protein n=1 Tax=Synechococcus sp. (strain ATCC 29403 / PCC 7335) TaxID=91464 RepID=UPI00017EC3C8|nr:diguanylate cyclase [Synechococcus sp. PCC 7335]EDX85819.1 GGDEF domain protein [Synechococcus sp. PCC 7335]
MLTYVTEGINPHTLQQVPQSNQFALRDLQPQRLVQQQRLREVERKIRRTLDLKTVLGTTVVEIARLFGASQVVLIQPDRTHTTYQQVSRYCQNQSLSWQLPFTFCHADFPSLLEQLWQGQPIDLSLALSQTNESVDEFRQSYCSLKQDIQRWQARWLGNWLLIPVQNALVPSATSRLSQSPSQCGASQYWGILALALANDQTWSASAVTDTQSIATELASAIAHSIQHQALITNNQALQKLALSDGLTSIANRRRFDEYIEDEWQRLARDQQPLSLILCDIDQFKLYNDTFGHPAGDRCLIHIARALLQVSQRSADLVARYGGEEFAIILPNTDTHGAWRVAQNIHSSIRGLQIAHAASSNEPYLSVTLGIATIIPGPDSTPQVLLQASDIALYYAKQQGRNRTYINGHHNTINHSDLIPKAAVDAKLELTPNG